jgi:hypothetical protein
MGGRCLHGLGGSLAVREGEHEGDGATIRRWTGMYTPGLADGDPDKPVLALLGEGEGEEESVCAQNAAGIATWSGMGIGRDIRRRSGVCSACDGVAG